jgi:hypothetical protein
LYTISHLEIYTFDGFEAYLKQLRTKGHDWGEMFSDEAIKKAQGEQPDPPYLAV